MGVFFKSLVHKHYCKPFFSHFAMTAKICQITEYALTFYPHSFILKTVCFKKSVSIVNYAQTPNKIIFSEIILLLRENVFL